MRKVPPNPDVFNPTVWLIAAQVPLGSVTTFGQIASMFKYPADFDAEEFSRFAPYWVGQAMNMARIEDDLPWQRVINGQGKISLPSESKGAAIQRERLEQEGIEFDSRDRVDLQRYGWDGPSTDWLDEHNLLPPKPLKKKPANSPSDDSPEQLSLF